MRLPLEKGHARQIASDRRRRTTDALTIMRGKPRSRSRRPPFPALDGAKVSSFRHFCGRRMPRSPPRRKSIEKTTFLEPPLAWNIFTGTRHFFGGGLGTAFYGGPLRRQWRPLLNTLYTKGRKSIEKTHLIAHCDALRRPLPCEQLFYSSLR